MSLRTPFFPTGTYPNFWVAPYADWPLVVPLLVNRDRPRQVVVLIPRHVLMMLRDLGPEGTVYEDVCAVLGQLLCRGLPGSYLLQDALPYSFWSAICKNLGVVWTSTA